MGPIYRTAKLTAFALTAALAVILCGYGVFADAQTIQADGEPPFTVTAADSGSASAVIGADIGFFRAPGNSWFLFLPGTADPGSVRVRYDGRMSAYDESAGKRIKPGDTYVCDLSADGSGRGEASLVEYDEENGIYYRYPFTVMRGGDIPVIYISLEDGDSSLLRINSSKENVETGYLRMTGVGGSYIYDGELTKIKGHGNTSYEQSNKTNTKNSYNINLAEKTELIPGAGKSRKWTLLRIRTWGEYDPTGLSYLTAFDTYNALIGDNGFRIGAEFVDVYIDSDYRGVYVLTERPDINGAIEITDLEKLTDMPSSRTKRVTDSGDPAIEKGIQSYSYAVDSTVPDGTDITGGYVLEISCGHYGECGFKTREGMYVNIKSPKYPTMEMVRYIASYVQDFENALFSKTGYNDLGKHWSEYADTDGYAVQTLVYSFYLNWEIYRTSTYLTKDAGGILEFGPVWDFESGPVVMYDDTLFGVRFGYSEKQQYIWFQEAWKKGDYLYKVYETNNRMREILSQMLGYSASDGLIWKIDDMARTIKPSQEMNWIRWKQPGSYSDWYDDMYEALGHRYDHWFDDLWNPDKYLLGLTSECADNGDGTWTLKTRANGKIESDYAVWYVIEDDITKGRSFGTGYEITVPSGGRYYSLLMGPGNAYFRDAYGEVFSSKYMTVVSNVITVPDAAQSVEEMTTAEETGSENEQGSPTDGRIIAAVIITVICAAAAALFLIKMIAGKREKKA